MNPNEKERHLLFTCVHVLRRKLPELRGALDSNDPATVEAVAEDLRGTIHLLGLTSLFKLSQDIGYRREELGQSQWRDCCEHFLDQLDRCYRSLERVLAAS